MLLMVILWENMVGRSLGCDGKCGLMLRWLGGKSNNGYRGGALTFLV